MLAAGTVDSATPIVAAYPGGTGVIELISNGAVTWVDPRVVRGLSVGRHLIALAVLAVGVALSRREPGATRPVWRLVAVSVSAILAGLAAEAGLRALGSRRRAAW